jgi:glycosyltransferase involved in cell wall biosynthesis
MKIKVFITEDISIPIDEGIKKFSHQFICYAKQFQNALIFARFKPENLGILDLPQNKFFLSLKFRRKIRTSKPSYIIYIPFSSTTFFSFLRLFILSRYSRHSKKIIISLQRRKHNYFEKLFIKLFKPDLLITFSQQEREYYKRLGVKTFLSGIGVDTKKYLQVDITQKNALKIKYGFPQDVKLALHIGHINSDRNVTMLAELISIGYKVLIVGSTSTSTDDHLKNQLEKKGCVIYNHYIEKIEEIYQLADLYIFPVLAKNSAIEFPLSVLEAMSCNIPVFITRFGALPTFFIENENIKFFESKNEMISQIKAYNFELPCKNRDTVIESYTWDHIFGQIIKETELL